MFPITEAVREVAKGAIQLLEDNHWGQGANVRFDNDGETHFCAIGALGRANGSLAVHCYTEAREAVEQHLGIERGTLSSWNDQKGRTKEEVIAALRAVAEGQ